MFKSLSGDLRFFSLFLLCLLVTTVLDAETSCCKNKEKSLVDYFLPMQPVGGLQAEGLWGNANVLPRDVRNGLEDSELKSFCYWDGRIVQDDDGKYHLFASRWDQHFSHSDGWKDHSKGVHAVSEQVMGPYVDQGLIYPEWNGGLGHNVIGLRMHDGRWAVVSSEITPGDVFVSDNPYGPFEHMGEIKWDANGFDPGLAAYQGGTGHMSNVQLLLRPDGRYMIVARSTAVMISDDGILGPYKIVTDRMYADYPELPQSRNEDPTVWYSGGMYHIVYNHWPSKTSYHFSSVDGIHDWKYRGIAFKKEESKIFRYTDGTVNDWEFVERPTAYVENGHVTHFIFSVIDVHKGKDGANDNHGSKIVVVPFDGQAFDRDMHRLVHAENGANKHPEVDDFQKFDMSDFVVSRDTPAWITYYHGDELDVVNTGDSFTVSVDFTFDQRVSTVKKEIFRIGATTGQSGLFATFYRYGWGDHYSVGMKDEPEGAVFASKYFGLDHNSTIGTSDPLRMTMTLTRESRDKWTMVVHIKNLLPDNEFERRWEKSGLRFPTSWVKSLNGVFQVGHDDYAAGVSNRSIMHFGVSNASAPPPLPKPWKGVSFKDFILPMTPRGPLVSEGIWGADHVIPRDVRNGLEDSDLDEWCYWDGSILKGDDGKYHLYASRWKQSASHSDGWKIHSKAIHAVSDHVMGPYVDKGLIWPHWKAGKASNVSGVRMLDGRYAVVTSEITKGQVFVSDSPDGPFDFLGEIQVDYNGFDPGLAAYQGGKGNMSNVHIIVRPDGRYMLVPRTTAIMISDDGILGPYKILSDKVYKGIKGIPQTRMEDPTVWYSGGMYHLLVNHWPGKTTYHFSSEDGINDWKVRGIAYRKDENLFRYPNGQVEDWTFVERSTAYTENGHITHFNFSVIDVGKGQDQANDQHGSKIIVVPFDGEAFDREMQRIVAEEKAVEAENQE